MKQQANHQIKIAGRSMKYSASLFSAVRGPWLLQFQTAAVSFSLATTSASAFRFPFTARSPSAFQLSNFQYADHMKTTRRQTRSLLAEKDDIIDTKSPAKKKGKTVKTTVKKMATPTHTPEDGKPWYAFFTKGDEMYEAYMVNEWGYEKHTDQALFEKLCLEGAQAGLTWRTILQKRDAYRSTFHNFDLIQVADMNSSDVERIMNESPLDPKNTATVIVRHRGKIESVIHNARLVLQMKEEYVKKNGDSSSEVFARYLWSFVDHKPILNRRAPDNHASKSVESEAMSAALKKYGFKFVGPTTCYSLMQATGMVIDHPYQTPEWNLAYERLQKRPGGYQDRD